MLEEKLHNVIVIKNNNDEVVFVAKTQKVNDRQLNALLNEQQNTANKQEEEKRLLEQRIALLEKEIKEIKGE